MSFFNYSIFAVYLCNLVIKYLNWWALKYHYPEIGAQNQKCESNRFPVIYLNISCQRKKNKDIICALRRLRYLTVSNNDNNYNLTKFPSINKRKNPKQRALETKVHNNKWLVRSKLSAQKINKIVLAVAVLLFCTSH